MRYAEIVGEDAHQQANGFDEVLETINLSKSDGYQWVSRRSKGRSWPWVSFHPPQLPKRERPENGG